MAQGDYPRWIYKDGENPKIVQDPYQHMVEFKNGWSGPPIFDNDINDLKADIAATEKELQEMKDRLADMEIAEASVKLVEEEKEEETATLLKCTVCQREFKTEESLATHMKVHGNKK